jgi:streptomycin 6-kinase
VTPVEITVPAAFAHGLITAEGDRARAWLARLPGLAARYLTRWQLTVDGPPMHGMAGLVLPVRTGDGTGAVLKLSWPHDESEHEALALRVWQGPGVVRLVRADDTECVLLLEKLDHTRSLNDEPLSEAVDVCARYLRSLVVPAPPRIRTLTALAARWTAELPSEAGDHVPQRILAAAVTACERYGPVAATTLTNEDLHYENVLHGPDGWRMIDPKPITGDPEFGVIPLLWNRFDPPGLRARFAAIVRVAGLDADKARAWTLARAVDNWHWFTAAGDPDMAQACRLIAEALI